MGALGSNHVLADQGGGGAACWRRAAVAADALAVPLAAAGIAPPPASAAGGYTVTATIPVAAGPRAVAADAATHTVHVTNQGENDTIVAVFALAAHGSAARSFSRS